MSIEDRIAALWAKAQDGAATQAESEAFAAKAQELATRHAIDLAALNANADPSEIVSDWVEVRGAYATNRVSLLNVVAQVNCCSTVAHTGAHFPDGAYLKRGERRMHLFGTRASLDATRALYALLDQQMAVATAETVAPPGESTRAWRNSFQHGWLWAIHDRLRSAAQQATDAAPASGALALLDERERSRSAVHREYPRLRMSSSPRSNGNGRNAGRQAGANARFSTGASVGGRKALGR